VEIVPPLGWDMSATLDGAPQVPRAERRCHQRPRRPAGQLARQPADCGDDHPAADRQRGHLHLTCRDRNIIGMQSDLLGARRPAINNILIITGDPPKLGGLSVSPPRCSTWTRSVHPHREPPQSRRRHRRARRPAADQLHHRRRRRPSHLDQEREIDRFHQKVAAGAEYCITQPVFDAEVLLRFIEKVKHLGIPILAGIWPLPACATRNS